MENDDDLTADVKYRIENRKRDKKIIANGKYRQRPNSIRDGIKLYTDGHEQVVSHPLQKTFLWMRREYRYLLIVHRFKRSKKKKL